MIDIRDWLHREHKMRVTASEIADMLGVSRATATRRILDGLDAGAVITVCRFLGVNPVQALVGLGEVGESDVFDYLDRGQKLVATASDGELALELARRLNPASMAGDIGAIG